MSLLLASIIFKNTNAALVNNLVSLAVGTLLAASFLEIIPHAMEASNNNFHGISFTVLIGILILFILEKLMIWRHCHGSHCHKHTECDTESKQSKASGNRGIIVIGNDKLIGADVDDIVYLTDHSEHEFIIDGELLYKCEIEDILGKDKTHDLGLRMTAEDFAFYSHIVPVCFFRLGVGNTAKGITHNVHSARFDIEPKSMLTGLNVFSTIAFSSEI